MSINQDEFTKQVLETARQTITVRVNGEKQQKTAVEAVLQTLLKEAAGGDAKSLKLFLAITEKAFSEQRQEDLAIFEGFADIKIDLQRRRDKGQLKITNVQPEQILIDPLKGTVELIGPIDPEEIKVAVTSFRERTQLLSFVTDNKHQLGQPDCEFTPALRSANRRFQKRIAEIESCLGETYIRALEHYDN